MIEEEVHPLSKLFLEKQGYTDYCGVCNKNGKYGSGDVPIPTERDNKVQIDHKGEKKEDGRYVRRWHEDKGSCNLSTILEGFSRICYAVYYGGGDGLLVLPSDSFKIAMDNHDFLELIAKTTETKGDVGVLDIQTEKEVWF